MAEPLPGRVPLPFYLGRRVIAADFALLGSRVAILADRRRGIGRNCRSSRFISGPTGNILAALADPNRVGLVGDVQTRHDTPMVHSRVHGSVDAILLLLDLRVRRRPGSAFPK